MNTRTRMQLLAAFAASTVLFAAGCDQRNADRSASTGATPPSTSSMASSSSAPPSTSSSTPSSDTSSTSAAPSSSTMAAADDTTITTKVKAAVMAEPNLKSTEINVDTKDGVVTLAGVVGSQEAKQRANQVAQQVQGVKSVSDQLVVKPS